MAISGMCCNQNFQIHCSLKCGILMQVVANHAMQAYTLRLEKHCSLHSYYIIIIVAQNSDHAGVDPGMGEGECQGRLDLDSLPKFYCMRVSYTV